MDNPLYIGVTAPPASSVPEAPGYPHRIHAGRNPRLHIRVCISQIQAVTGLHPQFTAYDQRPVRSRLLRRSCLLASDAVKIIFSKYCLNILHRLMMRLIGVYCYLYPFFFRYSRSWEFRHKVLHLSYSISRSSPYIASELLHNEPDFHRRRP